MSSSQVEKHYNFLSDKLYNRVYLYAKKRLEKIDTLKNNFDFWPEEIVKDSGKVFICPLYEENKKLSKDILKEIEEKTGYIGFNPMIYWWTPASFIPWHNDGTYFGGCSIYLNTKWDINWGGYFLYKKTDESIQAIVPEANKAVIQTGKTWHATTPTSLESDNRLTLQVFLKGDNGKVKKKDGVIDTIWKTFKDGI